MPHNFPRSYSDRVFLKFVLCNIKKKLYTFAIDYLRKIRVGSQMTQSSRHGLLSIVLFFGMIVGLFHTPSAKAVSLYTNVPVSDTGTANNITYSNTSRNVAIARNGTIYVAYSGSDGIRVARSTNNGASFAASVQVSPLDREVEISVADNGIIYVAFVDGITAYISRSVNNGTTFSPPALVGAVAFYSLHIASDPPNVYILEGDGRQIFTNAANGVGAFTSTAVLDEVFADVTVDPATGEVIVITDNPGLNYFVSNDHAATFTEIPLTPVGDIFYSTGTWSITPAGRFWYASGDGSNGIVIDLDTGATLYRTFGTNYYAQGRQLAANGCNVIDGFTQSFTGVAFQVSNDSGATFNPLVVIPADGLYISLEINPVNDDIVVAYANGGQIFVDVYRNELATSCAEIDVLGQGTSIVSGDITPDVIDDTDFGTVATGSSVSHTFTIENTGFSALTPGSVTINGAAASDFTVTALPSSSIAPGTSSTFLIRFVPSTPGLRTASISMTNNDSDENPYTFAIQGTGTGNLLPPPTPSPAPLVKNNPASQPQPAISIFDPGISKLGFLMPGQTGVAGEEIRWIVTVSNFSSVSGQNIVVSDTLIDGLEINRVDAPGGTVSINGQTITVSYPALNPGESVQFSIFTTALQGQFVLNTACVNASNQGAEECATGSTISQLPRTGETPFQHRLLLFALITGIGVAFLAVIRRTLQKS